MTLEPHYEMVAENAGNLVVFLGAGINADGRSEAWAPGTALPDDRDVAQHLTIRAGLPETSASLAEVAQRAIAIHGAPKVFGWLRQTLVLPEDSTAHHVHRSLAELPAALAAAGHHGQYQMLVTSAYDADLERAFAVAGEAFDRAVFRVATDMPGQPGSFVHIPFDGMRTTIAVGAASSYTGLPIYRDPETSVMTLQCPLIVRTHGVVDDPVAHYEDWPDNYVLTEDDFIGYLSGTPVSQVVPAQILAKLKQANYLFLGFTLADWRLRVFLQRVWSGPALGRAVYWAVSPNPDELEQAMWRRAGVEVIGSGLADYLSGLLSYLRPPVSTGS
jgi:hypothetical protein